MWRYVRAQCMLGQKHHLVGMPLFPFITSVVELDFVLFGYKQSNLVEKKRKWREKMDALPSLTLVFCQIYLSK